MMRSIDPRLSEVDYCHALILADARNGPHAATLLQVALAKESNPAQRDRYTTGFLKAMAASHAYAVAYEAVPDGRTAFRVMQELAAERCDTAGMKKLIALHRRKVPDDPLLVYYQAEIFAKKGWYELADKTFMSALAHPLDPSALLRFRSSRVQARYHTGHAMDAYREIEPRADTFTQLAHLCLQAESNELLETLIEARAKEVPKSDDLLQFQIRLKIREGKLADGLALFKETLKGKLDDAKRAELVATFLNECRIAGKTVEGYRAAPDADEAFRILTGEWDEEGVGVGDMRRLIAAHRAIHPDDPWLAQQQAQLYCNEESWDKAAAVLMSAWQAGTDEIRLNLRYSLVYDLYKAGRWTDAFAEIEPHQDTFKQLADLLADDENPKDLAVLLEFQRPFGKNTPDFVYSQARCRALQLQPEPAAEFLELACKKQNNVQVRKRYSRAVVSDLATVGLPLKAYDIAADKNTAFETIAAKLVADKDQRNLAALLDEHRLLHAEDPAFHYYSGDQC
ncbi:MAG: hypothetical protein ACRD36_04680, partial [Candidatus Acidiferrum sp.]